MIEQFLMQLLNAQSMFLLRLPVTPYNMLSCVSGGHLCLITTIDLLVFYKP